MRRALAIACLIAVLPATAWARPVTEEQRAQLERLRGEIAGQIQLQAFDLLDELVYGWTQQPPFALETPVVLAGVSVPVGFGSGLQALIESHFMSLAVANADTNVTIAHCPQCTALVVHSQQKATIVARGVDEPEALALAGGLAGSKHALFLDFEAEGASLVLRARITSLEPALPIVYAKTLSTSTSSPALLRSGKQLKSAQEAHQEYIDTIEGIPSYTIPFRLSVRTYAKGSDALAVTPMAWIQVGFEGAITRSRAWTGALSVGYSYAPELHNAFMIQGRLARLVTGRTASLTHPDLYVFASVEAIDIRGIDAVAFRENVPTVEEVILLAEGKDPHEAFGVIQVGLEVRIKNRIATSMFLETIPGKVDALGIGDYWTPLGFIHFQTLGAEVAFCF